MKEKEEEEEEKKKKERRRRIERIIEISFHFFPSYTNIGCSKQ